MIITKGEDRIELNTNADFLAKEMKYTSIITITDVDKENQYSTFSIDGEMYLKNGLIVSKTNQVEDTDHINKKSCLHSIHVSYCQPDSKVIFGY